MDAGSDLPPARTLLVLGGGAMKGVAHIGVWKALQESGTRVDGIVGTSIGAVVGTCIAGGMGWRELSEVALALRKKDIVDINRRAIWFGGVHEPSVFEGERLKEWLGEVLPVKNFGQLELDLRINSVSLVSGREVWFGAGARCDLPLAQAVYCSCALPVYFPPARAGDDWLVDGGIVDGFPIRHAREWGAGRVIGVDVGADILPPKPGYFEKGMVAIHDRVLSLSLRRQHQNSLEDWHGPPLLYIRPEIGHLGGWDFDCTQFLLEEGYRAAREALEEVEAA
ncbi:MAG: patatin-like phospholipase family protein [Longimicrobiaceae bacterium]